MQVVLVYLQPFCRNSLSKCALQPKKKKFAKNLSFEGSRTFKVIDFDKSKKPVSSAYDKQLVHTYLQPFSHRRANKRQNNVFSRGYPSLTPSFEGNPLTQRHGILSRKTRVLGAAHSEDFVILACTVLIGIKGVTDRQTDRRTGHG